MRSFGRSLVVSSLAVWPLACKSPPPPSDKPDGPTLKDIVTQVQAALAKTRGLDIGDLKLKDVKLSLQTVKDSKGELGLGFLIFTVKGYHEEAGTSQIEVTLIPSPPPGSEAAAFIPSVEQELVDAISRARKTVAASYPSNPPGQSLSTSEVNIEVACEITKGKSGALDWPLKPIAPSASLDVSTKTTHTITLEFEAPTPPKSSQSLQPWDSLPADGQATSLTLTTTHGDTLSLPDSTVVTVVDSKGMPLPGIHLRIQPSAGDPGGQSITIQITADSAIARFPQDSRVHISPGITSSGSEPPRGLFK